MVKPSQRAMAPSKRQAMEVVPMPDEDLWEVPEGRRASLSAHNTRVRNDGRDDAIVYYPGSGADILHALFAVGANARYFILVDPGVALPDLAQALSTEIRVKNCQVNGRESRIRLDGLKIRSEPVRAWMFVTDNRPRYLFYFRARHQEFLAANRGFVCDVVFEKDFWETADDVELDGVLKILRIGGHYSTNANMGQLKTALELMGLDYVNSWLINGHQHLYLRVTDTGLSWDNVKAATEHGVQVIQEMMVNEDSALYYGAPNNQPAIVQALAREQNTMLQRFTRLVPSMTQDMRNRLCRELAIKACGATSERYIGAIHNAFH
jgi:hypothetical protein